MDHKAAAIGVEAKVQGDQTSPRARELARLFERHHHALVAFLAKRLPGEGEASDVAQEAYLRLLQLDNPGAISFLRAYLYRTALNIAHDRMSQRKEARRWEQSTDSGEPVDERGPERELGGRQAIGLVRQALLELPSNYRRAFFRCRFDEASTVQVGTELGLKSTQVRLYVRRVVAYCRHRVNGLTPHQAREQAFK